MLPNKGCQGKKSVSSMSAVLQTKVLLFYVYNRYGSIIDPYILSGKHGFQF
jgi:hypothetical protein